MSKKNKMFRFKTANLMNNLLVLPTMDNIERKEKMQLAPIKEFIKQNEEDLAVLDKCFKDMDSGYKAEQTILEPPESVETTTENLVVQFQQVTEQLTGVQEEGTGFTGKTAYWQSKHGFQFFKDKGDNKYYFGHCLAFDKNVTNLICTILEDEDYQKLIYAAVLALSRAIFSKKIVAFIVGILRKFINEFNKNLEECKNSPTGIRFWYFDRVDRIIHIFDKPDIDFQPNDPDWDPDDEYPNTEWNKIV